jgi:hypothetical protein
VGSASRSREMLKKTFHVRECLTEKGKLHHTTEKIIKNIFLKVGGEK